MSFSIEKSMVLSSGLEREKAKSISMAVPLGHRLIFK